MILTYLKITIRNLYKQKLFVACNLIGLSTGMASFLMIAYFVAHQLSYDRFWDNSDQLYRMNFINGNGEELCISPSALASHLRSDLPEVESVARSFSPFSLENSAQIRLGDTDFYEYEVAFVDSSFFDIFNIDLISGVGAKPLTGKHDVLLSESAAQRFFGVVNPIGETLTLWGREYAVQGVYRDIPSNSHVTFDVLLPLISDESQLYVWNYWNVQTYVKLVEGTIVSQTESKIKDVVLAHAGDHYLASWNSFRFTLQPVPDIHFDKDIKFDDHAATSRRYVWIALVIGLMVLALSCFNFVNLTISKLTERVKSVSLTKLLGANSRSIILHQVLEATMLSALSAGLSLVILIFAAPLFQSATQVEITWDARLVTLLVSFMMFLVLLIGIACGAYPASLVSRINLAAVLKNEQSTKITGAFARKSIVAFQFFVTLGLLLGMFVTTRQFEHLKKHDPGFNKDQVALVFLRNFSDVQKESFKTELQNLGSVEGVALASTPIGTTAGMWGFRTEEMPANDSRGIMHFMLADQDFLSVMGISLLDGRNFLVESDTNRAFLINEAAGRHLDLQKPIGAQLKTGEINGSVIGLFQDFYYASMTSSVEPLVIALKSLQPGERRRHPYRFAFVKVRKGDYSAALDEIRGVYRRIMPNQLAEISFQDEHFDRLHHEQHRLSLIISHFGVVALCLGLFGLYAISAYSCRRRAKEISIRRLFGSSTSGLILMLSQQLLRPVLVGALLALPTSYFILSWWLNTMTIHVQLNVSAFIGIAAFLCLLSAAVVSVEAFRISRINPAKVLRA